MADAIAVTFVVAVLFVLAAKLSFKSASVWICFILTIAAVLVTLADRQLTLVGDNDLKEGFTKAICLADGLVLGMSVSLQVLRITDRCSQRSSNLVKELEDIAGSFALYSLTVGTLLCLADFRALTLMQLLTYIFVSITNIRFITRFFRRSDKEGGKSQES